MPLKPPGPKSTACVAVSGKLVAADHWMGNVKIWSQRERVIEVERSRTSEPETNKTRSVVHDGKN